MLFTAEVILSLVSSLSSLYFYMVQQTGSDPGQWENIFIEAGISVTSAKLYTQTFVRKRLTKDSLLMLDCSMLKEMGIKTVSELFAILKLVKELTTSLVSIASQFNKKTDSQTFPNSIRNDETMILKIQNRLGLSKRILITIKTRAITPTSLLVLSYLPNPSARAGYDTRSIF